MPKPTLSALWDTGATNTTPLISGHVTDGYANNEIPGSAELNQWMMIVGQYADYLQQGDLVVNGLTLPWGAVVLTNATQTITPASGVLVTHLTGGGASAAIKGIVADVDGRVAVLVNTTGSDVSLVAQDSSAIPYYLVLNDAAIGASLRLPDGAAVAFRFDGANGQWNLIWSSCPLAPALSYAQVPLAPAVRLTNCGWTLNTENITSSAINWQFDSVSHGAWGLKVGDRIKSYGFTLPIAPSGTYTFNLCKRDAAGTGTVIETHNFTGVAGGIEASFNVAAPVAIQTGERWFIQVLGANSGDSLTDLHVSFDHPL